MWRDEKPPPPRPSSPGVSCPVHGVDFSQVTLQGLPELQLDPAHWGHAPCRRCHGAVIHGLTGRLVVTQGITCWGRGEAKSQELRLDALCPCISLSCGHFTCVQVRTQSVAHLKTWWEVQVITVSVVITQQFTWSCLTITPIHFSFAAVIMMFRDETAAITCRRRSPQSVYGGHRTPFSVHPFQLSQLPCRRLVGGVTDGKRNCHSERRKKQKNQFSGKIRQAVRTFDSLLLSF